MLKFVSITFSKMLFLFIISSLFLPHPVCSKVLLLPADKSIIPYGSLKHQRLCEGHPIKSISNHEVLTLHYNVHYRLSYIGLLN